MKRTTRFFATSLAVLLSICVFAVAGYAQHEKSDNAVTAINEGAKKMMDGNKMIMDIMSKKGIQDPDLKSAEKMMTEGHDMITKGQSMMTGSTMAEGKEMVKKGAKMMLEAQKATTAVVEKHHMVQECTIALDSCTWGEEKIKAGALEWFFGGP